MHAFKGSFRPGSGKTIWTVATWIGAASCRHLSALRRFVSRRPSRWPMRTRSSRYIAAISNRLEHTMPCLKAKTMIPGADHWVQQENLEAVNTYLLRFFETTLSNVLPYDWHTFFEERVYKVSQQPSTGGLELAGWRLVYDDKPNVRTFWGELVNPLAHHGEHSPVSRSGVMKGSLTCGREAQSTKRV